MGQIQAAASHDGMEIALLAWSGVYPDTTGHSMKGFAMLTLADVFAGFRSGLAARPFLPRVAITLLLGALAVADKACAGIVIGPGGHFPFGGTTQWEANAEAESFASGITPWSFNGTGTTSTAPGSTSSIAQGFEDVSVPYGASMRLSHLAIATTTNSPKTAELKASSSAAGALYAGRSSVRGWATAVINDRVLVKPAGGSFNFGLIEFEWTVTGNLRSMIDSGGSLGDGRPLNTPHGIKWAHYAKAETFVAYRDPSTGAIEQSNQTISQISMVGNPMTADQEGARDYLRHSLPDPQTVRGVIHLPNYTLYDINPPVSNTGGYTNLIAGSWRDPIPLMIGLSVFHNAVWEVEDFGTIEVEASADFGSTAVLTGVRLYNPDGSPYTGQWTLESENGIDYNEVVAVPEPSTCMMALAGLACGGTSMCRRRKRA